MRWVFRLFGTLRRTLVVLVLLASLALNVATVTSTAVFTAVSGAVSAVTGASTVLARKAAQDRARATAVRRTTQSVTRRAARGAARNSASAFGEALPFAGVAVVAAALAWEIRDACATAQDMMVLEGLVDDPAADPEALAAGFSCTDLIPEAEDVPTASEIWSQVSRAQASAWAQAKSLYGDLPDRMPQGLPGP